MVCSGRRKEKQRRYLRPAIAMVVATYFLNFCTLNPHLHAAMLRQSPQSHEARAGHCARPFVAPHAPDSHPANQEQRAEPLCCGLRGAQNKALRVATTQTAASPLSLIMLLPPAAEVLTKEVPLLPLSQVKHASHPPPLYLMHVVLLI
jgi:hypothetical protein